MLRKTIKGFLRLTTAGMKVSPYHMNRYYMYRSIKAALAKANRAGLGEKILSVSWSEDLVKCFALQNPDITVARYWSKDDPKKGNNISQDIRELSYPDNSFDYIAADQVLEHVDGNWDGAFEEVRRVLKPGGIAVLTTCLLQELHEQPNDFIRFTHYGLKLLAKKYSEIIEAKGWGNKLAFFAFRYMKVPEASWHPVNRIAMWNDQESPMLTWIVVRK
jgi:SAM-dependent methyltransferase